MALDEITRTLEQIGIDIRTPDGRREVRMRLDYLDNLYDDRETNRAALDWVRDLMTMRPTVRTTTEWVTNRISAEAANREIVRKTLIEKMTSGTIGILLGGAGAALLSLLLNKGHIP